MLSVVTSWLRVWRAAAAAAAVTGWSFSTVWVVSWYERGHDTDTSITHQSSLFFNIQSTLPDTLHHRLTFTFWVLFYKRRNSPSLLTWAPLSYKAVVASSFEGNEPHWADEKVVLPGDEKLEILDWLEHLIVLTDNMISSVRCKY